MHFPASQAGFAQLMERIGFYRDGKPTPGIIEAQSLAPNNRTEKWIKYNAVVDKDKLNATAIFELSSSPCIYFKRLDQSEPTVKELDQLHKLAWNQGLAPMLWVVTPSKILLYNCYSKPSSDDASDPSGHLIDFFDKTEAELRRLNDFAGLLEIESGRFWQKEKARQIDRRQRVDRALLNDLQETEKLLVEEGLDRSVAHALLGRTIFVAYLQDRKILKQQFFISRFQSKNLAEVLANKSATYDLFDWVHQTFNGDLFPLRHIVGGRTALERNLVKHNHLETIREWISKTDMRTGQRSLWPYDFSVVPVELISSIYEMFAHAGDTSIARERSTHYTPINLVDLVLSQVFEGLSADANILDLSCGSGVFLVEALRRLVAGQLANGAEWTREMVREVLYKQIYGVDINKEAVQIAAFSLYLTALELDPDPQPPRALKFRPLIEQNLFASDAFDENASFNKREPFASKNFGAVVGNPPWTWKRSNSNKSGVEYCIKRNYPISRENPDQAFLLRIGDFSNYNTVIGVILHSKPFFSHTDTAHKAKEAIFKRYRSRVLINCSDLRNDGLFPTAVAPAIIMIAEGRSPTTGDPMHLICPQRTESFKHHGIIEIGPQDIKQISISNIASDPDALKVASWGNARDFTLIRRIRDAFPSLGSHIRSNNWFAGLGFIIGNRANDATVLYGKKWLPSGEMPQYFLDPDTLDRLQIQKMERPRDPRRYIGPLVITPRGQSGTRILATFSTKDVVFTQLYYGIPIPPHQIRWAHYFNGILNSALATYFLFLTASTWGIERDEIPPEDLLRLPIPDLDANNEHKAEAVIEAENAIVSATIKKIRLTPQMQQGLDKAVFDLYRLGETDQVLVQDTVNLTIDLRMNRERSPSLHPPTPSELEAYAIQLIGVLEPFFKAIDEHKIVAEIIVTDTAPLQVIRFGFVPRSSQYAVIQNTFSHGLEETLKKIAEHLPQKMADSIYTRRLLRVYKRDEVYIVKPAERRYWSRSAGLNDADAILAEHLGAKRDPVH